MTRRELMRSQLAAATVVPGGGALDARERTGASGRGAVRGAAQAGGVRG
ncbi:hypothetical protein ACQPYH_43530 [Kribbella sp. CA-245084]